MLYNRQYVSACFIAIMFFVNAYSFNPVGIITNNAGYTLDIIGYFNEGESNGTNFRGEFFIENGQSFDLKIFGFTPSTDYRMALMLRQKSDPKSKEGSKQWVKAVYDQGFWTFKVCYGDYSQYQAGNFDSQISFQDAALPKVNLVNENGRIVWKKESGSQETQSAPRLSRSDCLREQASTTCGNSGGFQMIDPSNGKCVCRDNSVHYLSGNCP